MKKGPKEMLLKWGLMVAGAESGLGGLAEIKKAAPFKTLAEILDKGRI